MTGKEWQKALNTKKCISCGSKQKGSFECMETKNGSPCGVYICYLYEENKNEFQEVKKSDAI
jgi:hypothetical protein